MSRKGLGMTTVQDDDGRLLGVITDGDLRRLMEKDSDPLALNGRSGYVFGIIARRSDPEPFGNGMDEWLENVEPVRPIRWEAHS